MSVRVAISPSSFAAADDSPLRRLEAAGCEVVPNPYGRRLTEEEITGHLKGIDGLVAGLEPLNARVLASAPQLKAIARVGIGMDNVDHDAAKAHGVKVSNTPDGPTNAVAELTVTALLALLREILPSNAALHRGDWDKIIGRSISGRRVLLAGFGRIGRRTGEMLSALGATISVYDPYLGDAPLPEGYTRADDLHAALGEADAVSLHAAGKEVIIGAAEFDAMRDGTLLLNSARGELVDEPALIRALESGRLDGAWFDAFWEEPYTGPLTAFDKVLLTPHVGTYTKECRLRMEMDAVNNLLRDLGVDG